MMELFQSLVNYFVLRSRRLHRRKTTTIALLAFTFFLCCYPWLPSFNRSFDCPSEVNYGNASLKAKGINVVSYKDFMTNKLGRGKRHIVLDQIPDYDNEKLLRKSECVDMILMFTLQRIKICIYDPTQDLLLSYHLKTFGSWEKENVAEMLKALQIFPDMKLVDLGSSVGVFTLQAAATGTEVIAVDALLSNHHLLQQSLIKNNLSCLVTHIHNAVHGKRGEMRITVDPANVGGSIVNEILSFRQEKVVNSRRVYSICLNDLVPLVQGQDVFLKIDLEGSEEAVLSCAEEFFRETNVKVLMMEWMNYRQNEKASVKIKTFLTSHHMVPTWGVDRVRVIDLDASHSWPDNVFWMKE